MKIWKIWYKDLFTQDQGIFDVNFATYNDAEKEEKRLRKSNNKVIYWIRSEDKDENMEN
jgi:hypothetical protein